MRMLGRAYGLLDGHFAGTFEVFWSFVKSTCADPTAIRPQSSTSLEMETSSTMTSARMATRHGGPFFMTIGSCTWWVPSAVVFRAWN